MASVATEASVHGDGHGHPCRLRDGLAVMVLECVGRGSQAQDQAGERENPQASRGQGAIVARPSTPAGGGAQGAGSA